jgi:FtsZ-interacting cell division protein ZipA
MMSFLHKLPLSELQLSLLAIGLIAIVVVWGYNFWQERKHRKQAQRIFSAEQSDVLMLKQEGDAPEQHDTNAVFTGTMERIEPVMPPFAEDVVDVPPSAALAETPADELVDCTVYLNATELVAAPLFWAAQQQELGALAGRLRWFGMDEDNGEWRQMDARDAASYRRLLGALQVADRNGPVDAGDLDLFAAGIRQLAENFNAHFEMPAMPEVLAHAQALDEFCAAVDWRLAINLVHCNGLTLPLAGITQLAEAAGLRLGNDHVFHATDGAGQTLFTLADLGGLPFAGEALHGLTTSGVTLTIDVPNVADGSTVFDRMLNFARHLVTALDAALVDDQRMAISDAALAMIRAKIDEFQQKMTEHDIPAGSRRALRLYS